MHRCKGQSEKYIERVREIEICVRKEERVRSKQRERERETETETGREMRDKKASQNELKLIFKSPRFVPFGTNQTQFGCQI